MVSRFGRLLLTIALVLIAISSGAADVRELIKKLKSAEDFRVRVQAALELGKTKNPMVREPLEGALDDDNPAVRASAAAALKVLADKQALPALKSHQGDSSSAVRAQIKITIGALESQSDAGSSDKPRVLVKVGRMKNGTGVASSEVETALEQASRTKLAALPGVKVVDDGDDVNAEAKKKNLPAVMVTGRIRKLNASRDGDDVVYSASVEYLLHRMPEQSLVGTVSGSASARASPQEARDKQKSADIRSAVLEAAISSAIRRTPEALLAAAR